MWGARVRGSIERGWRGGGFDGGDLLLAVGLLGDAQLFFHLGAELVGSAAEVGHQLAELAREHGQLLRAEEQKCEDDEEGAVPKLGIDRPMIRLEW
jgi:hypothetical protein